MKSIKAIWNAIPFKSLLVVPSAIYWLGAILNQIVMIANGAMMPVLMPGGCPVDADGGILDPVHKCMTAATHLKFLADIINVHVFIGSLGDMLLFLGDAITLPAVFIWAGLAAREFYDAKSGVLRQS